MIRLWKISCCVLLLGLPASALAGSLDFGTATVAGSGKSLTYQAPGSSPLSFRLQYGMDFAPVSGQCSGLAACTIAVTFAPKSPGLRQDALRVLDSNGNLVTTIYLSGIGQGPQAVLWPGIIDTFAGRAGGFGNLGDNGKANKATFSNVQAVAVDAAGNVYISDSVAAVVRRVDAVTGVITTVAGSGVAGFSGDNGPATSAQLSAPMGIALDGAGNLYIADHDNNRVRKVDAFSRTITTIAGTGSQSSPLGDGGPATSAMLYWPSDVAVDTVGNVYVADTLNNRVRKIDASGTITTVAGGGTPAATADGIGNGGPGTGAVLSNPMSVTLDSSGNLYIADSGNNLVRQVKGGIISAVAGDGTPGFNGDSGLATDASLMKPVSVRIDGGGNLYIADWGNSVVRQVNAAGIITTIIGNPGQFGYLGDGGSAVRAALNAPIAIALDPAGNIYIADQGNNVVRSVSPISGPLSFDPTVVGTMSAAQLLTLSNIGNAALNLASLTFPKSFQQQLYGYGDCSFPSVLLPGSGCVISTAFAPLAAGQLSGSLSVNDDSLNTNSQQSVGVSGTGLAGSKPVAVLNTASLVFGTQQVGRVSTAQTVTLSNTGSANLNISSIMLVGTGAADFTITTCSASLAPAQKCTISVTFAPRNTGIRTASIIFADNVASSPQTVALTGTALGSVAPPGIYDDTDSRILYIGSWGHNSDTGRYQSTQSYSNVAGSAAVFTFTGTQVTYVYETQANMGHVQVAIDGAVVTTDLDEYSVVLTPQQAVTYSGLGYGPHTITVTVLGKKDSVSSGSYVIIDAFAVGPVAAGVYDDSDLRLVYTGSWGHNTEAGRYNGTQSFSKTVKDTLTFTFTGTQITYVYETQSNMGHAQVTIDQNIVVAKDLDQYSAVPVSQKKLTYSGLSDGTHTVTVTVLGTKSAASSDYYVIVDAFIVGSAPAGIYDDTDPWIMYGGSWGHNSDTGRYNGTQSYSNTAGNMVSFTFTGTQVTYVFEAQNNMGHAQVAIDGTVMTPDLNQYSVVPVFQKQMTYSGLGNGLHTITVTVLGKKDIVSSGSYVIVDAFIAGSARAGTYDDTDPWVMYGGSWGHNTDTGRYNGTQSYSNTAGDIASFTFAGTQVTYVFEAQANMGHAQVAIDDTVVTPDLNEYSAVPVFQKKMTYSGLSNEPHTITVTVLGKKDTASSGSYVIVDAFIAAP